MNLDAVLTATATGAIGALFVWLRGRLAHQDRNVRKIHILVNSRLTTALVELAVVRRALAVASGDRAGVEEADAELERLQRAPVE